MGDYAECSWDTNSPSGVCPDSIFAGGYNMGANNTKLVYGQEVDGKFCTKISFLLLSLVLSFLALQIPVCPCIIAFFK